ncbi:PKD domain-containing protein, partial [Octadecabacter sp.]|nr:PKD domain-containing protein [Octadecabacter sp.]
MPLDIEFTLIDVSVSAQINVSRSNLKVAPEGMIFTVDLDGFDTPGPTTEGGYNPQLHELYYFWDFGDPESTFSATTNVLDHQKGANTLTGPVAAHTFAQAGDYTVSVLIMEPSSGKATMATLDLTDNERVQDPAVVFAGDNTYWMDVNNDGAGSPTGSLVYDDIQSALDHAWQNNKLCRLLFRDGQTWDVGTTLDVRGERAYVNIMMAAEGGNPAILRVTNTSLMQFRNWYENNTLDVVAVGMRFEGPWDEVTELNPEDAEAVMGFALQTNTAHQHSVDYFWTHGCSFDGFYSAVNTGPYGKADSALGMSNCNVGSWLNIGIFLNEIRPTAIIGTRMARDPLALAGGEKFSHNVHGPIRSQRSGPMVIAKNDMFTNSGWFENKTGFRTQQPCLRLFQSGQHGGLVNISQNTFEGGYQIVALSRQDAAFGLGEQNAVVDGNLMIGGHQTVAAVAAEFGGITLRNNVYARANSASIAAIFDPDAFVRARLPSGSNVGPATTAELAANAGNPIKVYNNTYAMLKSDANFFDANSVQPAQMIDQTGFVAISEANNILHAPNAGTPIIKDNPIDTTTLFEPRMKEGYRSVYDRIEHALNAEVPDGKTFTVPYPSGRQASDYGPTTNIDPHEITTSTTRFNSNAGTAQFVFGDTEISVTNASGQTWETGQVILVLYALNNPPPLKTEFGSPIDTIALYAPLIGSAALGDAMMEPMAVSDFYGRPRPRNP